MAATRQSTDVTATHGGPIRAVQTRPGRVILTADGVPDAWIASDVLIDLEG